jgi:bisphosphoglycerate-dependent phosphoglycerate mutase
MWDYSFSIWEARNLTVHGRTETAKEGKLLKTLKREVKTLYQSFATDPHIVPQSRRNLFDKPQDYLLQLPTSYIHCWLLSVREAIETRKFWVNKQESRQRQLMKNFFKPRRKSVVQRKKLKTLPVLPLIHSVCTESPTHMYSSFVCIQYQEGVL